ncbi:hypothetical protein ACFYOD_18765 [Streptomyces sp. NPDC006703]|uniref:hypothetical protein n=1 Tax=Streptomyces sp. NPDC006703 TaxID=3364759 RepID=UPI0036A6335B
MNLNDSDDATMNTVFSRVELPSVYWLELARHEADECVWCAPRSVRALVLAARLRVFMLGFTIITVTSAATAVFHCMD